MKTLFRLAAYGLAALVSVIALAFLTVGAGLSLLAAVLERHSWTEGEKAPHGHQLDLWFHRN